MSRRLSVVMGDRDYAVLTRLASDGGISVSDLVRECLKVGVWYQSEVASHPGRRLLIDRGEGPGELVVVR